VRSLVVLVVVCVCVVVVVTGAVVVVAVGGMAVTAPVVVSATAPAVVPRLAVLVTPVSVAGAAASTDEAVTATIGSGETACQKAPKVSAVAATTAQRAGALFRVVFRRSV
jgi:hypothetical protein